MKQILLSFKQRLQLHWKQIVMYGGGSLAVMIIAVQFAYPNNQLLPYETIDNMSVSGWQKADAIWELDHQYAKKPIHIYFADNDKAYRSPTTSQVGLQIKNEARVNQMNYSWWLRLIPTSLIWGHAMIDDQSPHYERNQAKLDSYIKKELGKSCNVAPINATLEVKDKQLTVIPSATGGTCEIADIKSALKQAQPVLANDSSVRVPMKEIAPAVTTPAAQKLADDLSKHLDSDVPLMVKNEKVMIPVDQVMSWLDFSVQDGVLTPTMNSQRATDYMTKNIAPKVVVAAGVTKITTRDFMETARKDGASGQTLHIGSTLITVLEYLTDQRTEAQAKTTTVAPRIEYTRTYSPTDQGLSALLANYAKDHAGTFGISLIELSGKHRRASYNADKSFVTASTYKLFVAYSTLLRIDAGTWKWSDPNISKGRSVATCFDEMIVESNNACAHALLDKIGYQEITDEVQALGLTNTSFLIGDTPHSTAGDEALFLALLETGQLPLLDASRARLIDAMKRNIYRQGIPAGASGAVANKVGFLWDLLHDAAIVYTPSGTYVLVIMTEGSTWGAIADLTNQIEALRSK